MLRKMLASFVIVLTLSACDVDSTLSAENPVEALRSQSASMLDIGLVRANQYFSRALETLNESSNRDFTSKRVKTYGGVVAHLAHDGLIEVSIWVRVEGMLNGSMCEKHIMDVHFIVSQKVAGWFFPYTLAMSTPANLGDFVRIVCTVHGDYPSLLRTELLLSEDKPEVVFWKRSEN